MSDSLRFAAICFLWGCFALAGCKSGSSVRSYGVAIEGNPQHGKELIQSYGCGACHIIPGVRGAHGLVGPPLNLFADRTMVGGVVPNTPDNLVRWVENPPSIDPKTAMPDLGLSQSQAQDIAAYLYTLR
jgi:cytochrome c